MAHKLPCHVTILEARDLKAADVQGSSDPLVVVSLKGLLKKKHRTATIANTVNPVWDETFILEPHHPEKDSIVIKVYDKDVVKNDLLGMLRLPLFNYFNRGMIDEWRPLVTRTGQPARGDIRIRINWGTEPIAHALPGSVSMMENRSAYGESAALNNSNNLYPGQNLAGPVGHNPLDRNHDGRVDARDLTQPNTNQGFLNSQNNSTGTYPVQTAGAVGHNPLDRNHDGRVDARDLTQANTNQGLLNSQNNSTGTYPVQSAHHNPLDRNHDGRVDARDLTQPNANQGVVYSQQSSTGAYPPSMTTTSVQSNAHHNPLDRNHDGRVDVHDLTGGRTTTTTTSTTFNAQPHTLNPLDRNNDGKVDARDLSGRQQVAGQPAPTFRY